MLLPSDRGSWTWTCTWAWHVRRPVVLFLRAKSVRKAPSEPLSKALASLASPRRLPCISSRHGRKLAAFPNLAQLIWQTLATRPSRAQRLTLIILRGAARALAALPQRRVAGQIYLHTQPSSLYPGTLASCSCPVRSELGTTCRWNVGAHSHAAIASLLLLVMRRTAAARLMMPHPTKMPTRPALCRTCPTVPLVVTYSESSLLIDRTVTIRFLISSRLILPLRASSATNTLLFLISFVYFLGQLSHHVGQHSLPFHVCRDHSRAVVRRHRL